MDEREFLVTLGDPNLKIAHKVYLFRRQNKFLRRKSAYLIVPVMGRR